MPAPTTEDMHTAATELRDAIADHERICRGIGGDPLNPGKPGAEAIWAKARLDAHARSTIEHPDRKVAEHDTAADQESFDQWAYLTALRYQLRSLKEQMHSLRQILSAYQTQARTERDAP